MDHTHTLRSIRRFATSRRAACFLALFVAPLGMPAQNLPATPPTTLPNAQPGQVTPGAPPPPANTPLHADVLYANGQLQVRADNSSLNQILRSIAHVTGLKITGGVEEQRVFGSYGPAPLSTILATLLDGTGSNILLLGGSAGTPPELILTSRTGGPELPSPTSPTYAMYDDSNDRATRVPPPSASPSPTAPTAALPPTNMVATPSAPPSAAAAPSPARAPGQPLTPEMVAQELLQMQAQQNQKKKELDQKIQQQQVDQNKRLNPPKPQ